MNIAITGGCGFLGSNLIRRLLALGNEVTIMDNLSSGSIKNLSDLGIDQPIINGDLLDYEFTKRALANIDTVFHFAADIGGISYLHGPAEREMAILNANLRCDTNVFRACKENKVGCIIYASSCAIYPIDSHEPFKEDDERINPDGGYGWAKYHGERMLSLLDAKIGIARLFHIYGPNISLDRERSQVVGALIKRAVLYPKESFIVWGDGTVRRSFLYVDDAIEAIIKLWEYVLLKNNFTMNVGSDIEVSILDLAKQIVRLSGKDIQMRFDLTKPRGLSERRADISRAKEVLKWEPTTDFTIGLAKTYEWATKRLK